MEQSRKNYIEDCNIKSLYNNDTIYQFLSQKKVQDIAKIGHEHVFDLYVEFIKSNIKQAYNNESTDLFDIEFHKQYGWKISSRNGISYLGKFNVSGNSKISIGIKSYISGTISIFGGNQLAIGSYCSLANGIEVFTSNINHPTSFPSTYNMYSNSRVVEENESMNLPAFEEFIFGLNKRKDVIIGNDVWIGRSVFIMNGITIPDGCIIGAKSVVTKNCLPYGIYAGSPAKLIRFRFPPEIVEQLLILKWWDWSIQKIKNNTHFFDTELINFKGNINSLVK